MTPTERADIEARLAKVPAWTLSPRHIHDCARVEAGADPLAMAEAADPDAFLGWELEPQLDEADRGLTGPQAAQLVHLACDARALLDALAETEANHDRMLRWFDTAQHNGRLVDAADEQARRAEARVAGLEAHLSAIVAERDELALTLANERGEGPPPSDGWEWRVENTEGFWHRPGEPRRDVNRCYCDREDERIGRLRWHWWIVSGTYEATEIHGSGWEDTAHAAMIAADAAGGSDGR